MDDLIQKEVYDLETKYGMLFQPYGENLDNWKKDLRNSLHKIKDEVKREAIEKIENSFTWTQNYEKTKKPGVLKLNGEPYIHIEWKTWKKFLSSLKEGE